MNKMSRRHPGTTQERKANQEGWNRLSRNNLPDYRDELWRRYQRCWKEYRRTQYKTK